MFHGNATEPHMSLPQAADTSAVFRATCAPFRHGTFERARISRARTPNDLDAVFITRNGTWHFPTNIQGRLRNIRLLDDYAALAALQDVSPHSFRRTVATEIDEVYDAEAAMNQLGHTSKVVTERHYINRRLVVPDYRAATDRLAPGPETSDGPTPGP